MEMPMGDEFSQSSCNRTHDGVNSYIANVEGRLSGRIDKIDSKLWGLLIVGFTNMGGIIVVLVKALI